MCARARTIQGGTGGFCKVTFGPTKTGFGPVWSAPGETTGPNAFWGMIDPMAQKRITKREIDALTAFLSGTGTLADFAKHLELPEGGFDPEKIAKFGKYSTKNLRHLLQLSNPDAVPDLALPSGRKYVAEEDSELAFSHVVGDAITCALRKFPNAKSPFVRIDWVEQTGFHQVSGLNIHGFPDSDTTIAEGIISRTTRDIVWKASMNGQQVVGSYPKARIFIPSNYPAKDYVVGTLADGTGFLFAGFGLPIEITGYGLIVIMFSRPFVESYGVQFSLSEKQVIKATDE